ncbi:MAG TPA: hypothetical protein VGC55_07715 [Dokdonella sp.]
MSTPRIPACAPLALAALLSIVCHAAAATEFVVSGTLSVNGNAGALPDGGTFGDSTYDPSTGALSQGAFIFPQTTTSFPSDLGTVAVTYTLSQTNTSTGLVAPDGTAALTNASLKLNVTHVTISGIPISVGTCVFQPIDIALAGTGSATGLDLAETGFTIPEVAPTDCGGNGDQINQAIAGTNNAIEVVMAGDFAPPADSDTIFADGFEAGAGAD